MNKEDFLSVKGLKRDTIDLLESVFSGGTVKRCPDRRGITEHP